MDNQSLASSSAQCVINKTYCPFQLLNMLSAFQKKLPCQAYAKYQLHSPPILLFFQTNKRWLQPSTLPHRPHEVCIKQEQPHDRTMNLLNVMHKRLSYLNPARTEGPANTSPLVDTITGSTTKAAFNDYTNSFKMLIKQQQKKTCSIFKRTTYLEQDTP